MSKPNYTGIYNMISQRNFEEYLAALGKLQYIYFSQFCNLRAYCELLEVYKEYSYRITCSDSL